MGRQENKKMGKREGRKWKIGKIGKCEDGNEGSWKGEKHVKVRR